MLRIERWLGWAAKQKFSGVVLCYNSSLENYNFSNSKDVCACVIVAFGSVWWFPVIDVCCLRSKDVD